MPAAYNHLVRGEYSGSENKLIFQNEGNALPKIIKDATKFGITLFKGYTISL